MPPLEKRDWSEWGRYTLSAVAGGLITVIIGTLWLADIKHSAADAQSSNSQQDAQIANLTRIAADSQSTLVRMTTLMESVLPDHAARIRALESRAHGK